MVPEQDGRRGAFRGKNPDSGTKAANSPIAILQVMFTAVLTFGLHCIHFCKIVVQHDLSATDHINLA